MSRRKILVGALSIMLVVSLSIGGTLAFMTRETEKRVNNFTFADADEGLNAMLTEPSWDGVVDYEYDDDGNITNVIYDYIDDDKDPSTPDKPVYGYTDGDRSKPVVDPEATTGRGEKATKDSTDPTFKPEYGTDLSKDMIPGQKAPKNPKITNTGTMTDEWVAAKITFVYAESHPLAGQPMNAADMAKVTDVISIDWNLGTSDNQWERVHGAETSVSQTFYYRSILEKGAEDAAPGVYGEESDPIFTTVTVKSAATSAQLAEIQQMGGFSIYVEGFAVQSDVADSYNAFKAWGFGTDTAVATDDDNVVFAATPTVDSPALLTEPGIIAKN